MNDDMNLDISTIRAIREAMGIISRHGSAMQPQDLPEDTARAVETLQQASAGISQALQAMGAFLTVETEENTSAYHKGLGMGIAALSTMQIEFNHMAEVIKTG